MIDTTPVSSQLLFSTVRIEGHRANGQTSVGTAFFFTFNDDGREIPVLLTNKHVIAGCSSGAFLLHEAGQQAKQSPSSFRVNLDAFERVWLGHPTDIDLCAMPIAPLLRAAQQQGKEVFYVNFVENQIPNSELLSSLVALEDVIMVGYPIGLWDSVNNLPLLRRGVTATHPAVDFLNRPEGLVDIAAFPGSSGSPVMILNEGSYSTPKGITVGTRCLLLGVLYGGPQYRADGTLEIVEVPTGHIPSVTTQIPVHIGAYVKAQEILTLKTVITDLARRGTKRP